MIEALDIWDLSSFGVLAKEVKLENSITEKSSMEVLYLLMWEFVLRPENVIKKMRFFFPSGLGVQIY